MTAKPGADGRARWTKRAIASNWPAPRTEAAARGPADQGAGRRIPARPRGGDGAARDEDAQAPATRRAAPRRAAPGGNHLLEIVEYQQQLASRTKSLMPCSRSRSYFSRTPSARLRRRRPWADRGRPEGDEERAVREVGDEPVRRREGEPGLAGAAGAGEGDKPVRRTRSTRAASSARRPISEARGRGRLLGRASSDRIVGNSDGSPSISSCQSRSGSGRSLRRWLAEVAEVTAGGRCVATSARVESESSTWPPCPAAAMRAARWTSSPT